jgi:hypothetical protein
MLYIEREIVTKFSTEYNHKCFWRSKISLNSILIGVELKFEIYYKTIVLRLLFGFFFFFAKLDTNFILKLLI